MTQSDLGRAVGISYPQMYKYESGKDKITAGRLHVLASALGIQVSDLYETDEAVAAGRSLFGEFMRQAAALSESDLAAVARLTEHVAGRGV